MKWEELREEEFKEAIEKSGGLCVLPIGGMSVHGQHLPVGCDYFQARAYVEIAAEFEDVVIFPTGFWLGDTGSAANYKNPLSEHKAGYVCISPSLRLNLLLELCDEIARNGFRKILIVNAAAGNVGMLDYFVRAHAYEPRNYALMWTWASDFKNENVKMLYSTVKDSPERFPYIATEDLTALEKFAERGAGGNHGHINETAVMQHITPNCVNIQRSAEVDGRSTKRADYLEKEGINAEFIWHSNFPNSFSGYDSVGSSANIGRAMLEVSAERLARIFKMLKEDEDCVRMAMRLPKE